MFQQAPNGTGTVPTYKRYQALVGNTPIVDLSHLVATNNLPADFHEQVSIKVLAKVEYMNPGFSMKDRIVNEILNDAEYRGLLKPGGTIVAASSGNTGAATAMMAAMRGYKAIITTSPKCSQEKMDSIRAYGATLLVSKPGAKEGEPDHYMRMADIMAEQNPSWFNINQYDNTRNPKAHYNTLGPEIWNQTNGTVTHFIAGGSTGGTISGVGKYLKEQTDSRCEVILADPVGSIFSEHFRTGKHGKPRKFLTEGVGKGNIPGCLNFDVVDKVVEVHDDDAFTMCRTLAQSDGIMAGGSSGMNVYTAVSVAQSIIAQHMQNTKNVAEASTKAKRHYTIVTVLCDSGIKYLSKVYNPRWLEENGLSTERTFLKQGVKRGRDGLLKSEPRVCSPSNSSPDSPPDDFCDLTTETIKTSASRHIFDVAHTARTANSDGFMTDSASP